MKKSKVYFALFFLLIFFSCANEEVGADKQNYVGLWQPAEKNSDELYGIEIMGDGTGHILTQNRAKRLSLKVMCILKEQMYLQLGAG